MDSSGDEDDDGGHVRVAKKDGGWRRAAGCGARGKHSGGASVGAAADGGSVGRDLVIHIRDAVRTYADMARVCDAVRRLCLPSCGPGARTKLVKLNPASRSVSVTSCFTRVFAGLSMRENPTGQLLVGLVLPPFTRAVGSDGGLFCMAAVCGLVMQTVASERARHVPLVLAGHRLALAWALEWMSAADCPCRVDFSWSDVATMMACVRSVLASKPVAELQPNNQAALDHVAATVLQAFIAAIPPRGERVVRRSDGTFAGSIAVPQVRVMPVPGRPAVETQYVNGIVLDTGLPPGAPSKLVDVTVVLYNVSITYNAWEHIDEQLDVDLTSRAADADSRNAEFISWTAQRRLLVELADAWASVGVSMVASQKLIHPFLKQHLQEQHDIVCIERLSIRHIAAMQTVSGATVLGSLEPRIVDADVLGHLARVEDVAIRGKKRHYMVLEPSTESSTPISTLVLCAPHQQAVKEMEVVVSSAVHSLTKYISEPVALVGAGCCEVLLAEHLRARAAVHPKGNGDDSGGSSDMANCTCPASGACIHDAISMGSRPLDIDELRQVCLGIEDVASVLEAWAAALYSGVAERHEVELVELMRSANAVRCSAGGDDEDGALYGWSRGLDDPVQVFRRRKSSSGGQDTTDTTDAHTEEEAAMVLDCLANKRQCLQAAVEIAAVMLRVDCSIR